MKKKDKYLKQTHTKIKVHKKCTKIIGELSEQNVNIMTNSQTTKSKTTLDQLCEN